MKYKVGDKVRVRKDLKVNGDYGLYEFTDEMNKYLGKTTTITGYFGFYYTLDIDNHVSGWTESMLEPIVESIDQSDENTDKVLTNSVESVVENGQNTEKVRSKTDNLQKKI